MDRHWLEIDGERLAANLRAVREAAKGVEVLAVVKANAYGHGAELCAGVLAAAGARWFGVTDAAEGARVRAAVGDGAEILVMCGSLPGESTVIAENNLTPVAWTEAQVRGLLNLKHQKIHIEVDTGMGRQGVRPGPPLAALLAAIRDAGLVVDGMFTHLCASEVAGSELTREQERRFERAVREVRAAGVQPRWLHIGNSSAVEDAGGPVRRLDELARAAGARTMVRAGLALYGYLLPEAGGECEGVGAHTEAGLRRNLRPVLSWKARVLAVQELEAGGTVGYGATFLAPHRMRTALLPVGYADGLRRELSGPGTKAGAGGWVLARGSDGAPRRCPILGRISMNLTVVDCSAAPELAAGDAVTLLGGGVTADDHAELARTIAYEILCGIKTPEMRLL